MTLLVSWIGIDTHGPSSVYIAADSRLSWGRATLYDYGRKVFACRNSPDIFGYCGDVLFPSMVLGQIIEMAEMGLLFGPNASAIERSEAVLQKLTSQFAAYPAEVSGMAANSLEILHAGRCFNGTFSCSLICWARSTGWTREEMQMPPHSDVLFERGSVAADFKKRFNNYKLGPNGRTSRSVFHCFCDSLAHGSVPSVGGAPQLAGLIRKPGSNGIVFGIIADNKRYLLGTQIDEMSNFDRIEWRNELFEVCDGKTGDRRIGAQPQPNPHL